MLLPYQDIQLRCQTMKMIDPYVESTVAFGMTYGLGPAGYDVRIAEHVYLPAGGFSLASTIESFNIPDDLLPLVVNKSTWARRGLSAFNTVAEPGWRGKSLTLELANHGPDDIVLKRGMPICQILFLMLRAPTEMPYNGKYQDQPAGPVPAIYDKENGER